MDSNNRLGYNAYRQIVCETILQLASYVRVNDIPKLNERHIHHAFSCKLQQSRLSLGLDGTEAMLHPEWPTHKPIANIRFARYRRRNEREYHPDTSGGAGFVDFAIGDYQCPVIGVEFTLKHGWSREKIVFDLLKLMDPALPFELGASLIIVYRARRIMPTPLNRRLGEAYHEARDRLVSVRGSFDTRDLFLVVVEYLKTGDRGFWHLTSECNIYTGLPGV